MRTVQPLSGEATIPADDPAWSKPSHIPGQPKPIPPRNEPLLYIPNIHDNPHTSLDERSIDECELELGNHLASAVAQSTQEIQHGIQHKTQQTWVRLQSTEHYVDKENASGRPTPPDDAAWPGPSRKQAALGSPWLSSPLPALTVLLFPLVERASLRRLIPFLPLGS